MAKKQFLYENVYNDLKQKIECGDLKPGDKLAVEEDMIAHYGVSAITVKKALNLLAEEHRIRRIRGKGSFVMEYPEVGRIEVEELPMKAVFTFADYTLVIYIDPDMFQIIQMLNIIVIIIRIFDTIFCSVLCRINHPRTGSTSFCVLI